MLAVIAASGLVHFLVELVVAVLIFYLVWWLIGYMALPEPFNKVLRIIVAVLAVLFLINLLLTMIGQPMFVM